VKAEIRSLNLVPSLQLRGRQKYFIGFHSRVLRIKDMGVGTKTGRKLSKNWGKSQLMSPFTTTAFLYIVSFSFEVHC